MLSVLPGTIGGIKAISVDNSGAMYMTDDAFIRRMMPLLIVT